LLNLRWDIAQPDNLYGNEHCLSINLQYNTALLRDEKCEAKKRYICEVRIIFVYAICEGYDLFRFFKARQATGAKIIEIECGAAFNLTSGLKKNLQVLCE
jgi:hypothetical protein